MTVASVEALEEPVGPDDAGPPTRRQALAVFVPRAVLWVVVLTVVGAVRPSTVVSLMLVAIAGVATIVSDARFPIEQRLEARGVPTREAWVPLLMLVVLFAFDLVDTGRIDEVVGEQGPVIVFILAFALVSEGLGRSGFFHFLAYRLAERGGADTTRLVLYLFLLSSLLTYFTSNDIVVLTMTPIVLSVVYQARIRNAKLLLLSQFVAANTVSMGLLIGSPTNLIVGRAIDIGFIPHFLLMFAPTLVALMGSFIVVTRINRLVERLGAEREAPMGRLALGLAARRRKQSALARAIARRQRRFAEKQIGTWTFAPSYSTPRFARYRSFTREMGQWIGIFTLAVVLLAFGAGESGTLLLAALAIAVLGIGFLHVHAPRHGEPKGLRFLGRLVRELPLGIVFFGLTYFVIADAIVQQPFVQDDVEDAVARVGSTHTPLSSWAAIGTSGLLVNTMNDLPASALSGEVLAEVNERGTETLDGAGADGGPEGFATPFDRALVAQGLLAGLNIGTYVTPVGALAGIIWFNLLHKERQRRHRAAVEAGQEPFDVEMPGRRDLIVYGLVNFLAMTVLLGATTFGFVALADWLTGPLSGRTEFSDAPGHLLWTCLSLALAVWIVIWFFQVLRRHDVVLAHLADLLFLMTKLRLLAARHRVVTACALFAVMFALSAALLYHVELFHDGHYDAGGNWGGRQDTEFDGPLKFVFWLHVFITSGWEGEGSGVFPDSVFSRLVTPMLVLGAFASVVFVVRVLQTGSSDEKVRRRIAVGDIPTDRVMVVNAVMENRRLVETLASQPGRFVTVATRSPRLVRWLDDRQTDRMASFDYSLHAEDRDLVTELRLGEAREIVLLSRSVSDDFDNIELLTTLDAVLGGNGEDDALDPSEAPEGPELPAILLQRHGSELPDLVANRISRRLRRSVVSLAFADVVRTFLVADAAGRLEDLRRIYSGPAMVDGEATADRFIRIHGLHLALRVDTRSADDATLAAEAGVVVGMQVMTADRPDWRTFAARRAREVRREIRGSVILAGDGADQHTYGNDARSHVYVVGGDGLAQLCARDLVACGVKEVTLLIGPHDVLLPEMSSAGVEVRRCANELAATDILVGDDDSVDAAILVVESFAEGAFDVERLLERLSIKRLHQARHEPEAIVPLYVCCRGPDRARKIRKYVVDEIIDATWVEASYFAVFTSLVLDTMADNEVIANWPQERRLSIAHRIAHQVCHLELLRARDLWANEPAAADRTVIGLAGADAVREDRRIGPARGPLVGVIRLDVVHDDGQDPVVVVDIEVPAGDRPIEDDDLLVCLPCL